MMWEIVVALVIAIPVILFPAAYVGYLTIGGTVGAIKGARKVGAVEGKAVAR